MKTKKSQLLYFYAMMVGVFIATMALIFLR